MKLPIRKEYFDKIKAGEKTIEYRDAHITFICEETGEKIMKQVTDVSMVERHSDLFPDVLKDDWVIRFDLS